MDRIECPFTLQISLQESKSARHEAAADLQRSCEEAFHLQQQMFDLRQGVLEPLQAEHAAMLAALDDCAAAVR